MAQADDVTINASTTHTTDLARMTKEYVALHDKWQQLVAQAKSHMDEAIHLEDQAKALESQVAKAKSGLTQLLAGEQHGH